MNSSAPEMDKALLADPALAEAVEELTARLKAGGPEDLDAWLAARPEQAGELRRLFPMLRLLAELSRSGDVSVRPALSEGAVTGTLGDFRLIREVGRGGMGVVYEAEQISLGRRVALKVLPLAATMDPRHLQRFHNEARAAAGLHHTNIVPVYAVGVERGVPYYAMQFIDGQTLAAMIADLRKRGGRPALPEEQPTTPHVPGAPAADTAERAPASTERPALDAAYFRGVAEWGIQAAEALDHAHQLGVIHRDVKPANLLVDGCGGLWVTDFGLAQVQSDARLTVTGDLVGTLRYMSPEQALAKRMVIDHRTDVYSLGVTLYELLTLEPAFAGSDRQELLRQIAFEEPKPPRKVSRHIPAELETIVLKAMEKNPANRYAIARALADDLRRFLANEPILARRPSWHQVATKWVRRHRSLVAGAAAALLVGLAVLAGSVGWTVREQAARRAAAEPVIEATLEESDTWQRQRRLPESLAAARRADGLLAGADVGETLRQRVRVRLADLVLVESLENVRVDMTSAKDDNFDREGADALYQQIFREAGLEIEGLPAEEVGERLRRSTVAGELASALDHWASIRQRIRGADDPSWKGLLRVARAADPDPLRTRIRQALENRDMQALGALVASEDVSLLPPATLAVVGAGLVGEKAARGPVELFLRAAQRRHPDDFWLNHNLLVFFALPKATDLEEALHFVAVGVALRPSSPVARNNLGKILCDKGRVDEAIAEYREALRLKKDYPMVHNNLSLALRDAGQVDEAVAEAREALRLKPGFAAAHNNLGNALQDKGQLDEAIAEYRESLRFKSDAAAAHNGLGNALRAKGRVDEAIAEYREAISIEPDYAPSHNNLGYGLNDKGRVGEAIAEFREAIRLQPDLALAYINLGAVLHRQGQLDNAIAEYRKAIHIKRIKRDEAMAHNNLGNVLADKGQLDEAIAEFHEAIHLKNDYADPHYNLGIALSHVGRVDEAIVEYREAIRLENDHARAHCNLARCLNDKGQFAEALSYLRRGHELGSKDPHWPYPSAQWVAEYESQAALDAKLPAILSGKEQPADALERANCAFLCQKKRLNFAAVRLYREAISAQPDLVASPDSNLRYEAARAAALAGYGTGEDAANLTDAERAGLRQEALDWLRADLVAWNKLLVNNADKARPVVAKTMGHWLEDPDFGGVRGDAGFAKLPEAERRTWQQLWADVAATPARAEKKAGPEQKPSTK